MIEVFWLCCVVELKVFILAVKSVVSVDGCWHMLVILIEVKTRVDLASRLSL